MSNKKEYTINYENIDLARDICDEYGFCVIDSYFDKEECEYVVRKIDEWFLERNPELKFIDTWKYCLK